MKAPSIELTAEEATSLRERVAARSLREEDYGILLAILDTFVYLSQAVVKKGVSIKRLLKMLFGHRSEKSKDVLPPAAEQADPSTSPADRPPEGGLAEHEDKGPPEVKKKRKGHGRNGSAAYTGATRIRIDHPELEPRSPCPEPGCTGKLYEMNDPAVLVRLVGQTPIDAFAYERQRLRCSLCGKVHTAPLPDGVKSERDTWDESAISTVACFRYGFGMPFNRLATIQASQGIPLPPSTQWDMVDRGAVPAMCAYEELIRQAAQGQVLYNDDTPMRILSLMAERDKADEEVTGRRSSRMGGRTSGVVSTTDAWTAVLFFTGKQHAGENLADVLAHRSPDLPPPIQMADALSWNKPPGHTVERGSCNSHSRRQFVDVVDSFPEESSHVIETYRSVYRYDAIAKERNLSPEERLAFHQENSKPLMDDLQKWSETQLTEKRVEPNSALGEAISYMLKHWHALTLFLRKPGAPLDSNLVERILKMAIRHRKNSLFYKTENGAQVGDIYMSLIHTCLRNGANPFDYLTVIQRHYPAVHASPAGWMPWNYKHALPAAVPRGGG